MGTLMRFLLIGLLSLLLATPTRAAGPLLVNGAGQPLAWTADPIPFNPDRGSLGTLANADARALVQSLFDVWAAVPTASVAFGDAGLLPVDVTASNVFSYLGLCGDGLNPIIFDTDGSITDDLFGIGASDNILGFAGPDCVTFVPPSTDEGSAVLNGKWIDGVPGTEITLEEFKGVFVHEFGHYVNLDHSQVNLLEAFDGDPSNDGAVATMFPFLVNGAEEATLALDDEVSLSAQYPSPLLATTGGTVAGDVRRSDGRLFQGAHVVVRSVADPRITAVGMVSGAYHFPFFEGGPPASSLEGAFLVPGLPPGDYTVEIEEVSSFFTGGSSVGPLDPPARLPGVPEFFNGDDEAGTNPPDDPTVATPVAVAAGATVADVDVVINGFPPAPNDACADATVIPALPFTDTANTLSATTDPTDPFQFCGEGQSSNSVWYAITVPESGLLRVQTAGSDYDTVLSVFEGACGALSELACSDDAVGLQSSITLPVVAGQSLLIEVTSYGSFSGGGTLVLSVDRPQVTTYDGRYDDPIGDAFGADPQLDLSALAACRSAGSVRIDLEFATPIMPGASGAPNAIGGYVDIDVDQDPSTGSPSIVDVYSGQPSGLGIEYFVDLFSTSAGGALLFDQFGSVVGTVGASFGPTSVTLEVPLAMLGSDDGNVSLATVVGNQISATDFAPSDGHVATTTCAPSLGCGPRPRTGCKKPARSGRALLKVSDGTRDGRDVFTWRWLKGAGTFREEFGDPTVSTGYSVCVYDGVAGVLTPVLEFTVPGGATCGATPCWAETNAGFAYRSRGDLRRIILREGVGGRSSIEVEAKGPDLLPVGLPFDQSPKVVVQLVNDAGACWDADFSAPSRKNDGKRFADRGD